MIETGPASHQVQEYVEMYLGASSSAQAFSSEFLRRLRADPSLAKRRAALLPLSLHTQSAAARAHGPQATRHGQHAVACEHATLHLGLLRALGPAFGGGEGSGGLGRGESSRRGAAGQGVAAGCEENV